MAGDWVGARASEDLDVPLIDVVLHRQVGEKGLDFGGAHLRRMAFAVKEDEASNPAHVGGFGADGVVFGAQNVAHPVQQFFGWRLHVRFSPFDRFQVLLYNSVVEALSSHSAKEPDGGGIIRYFSAFATRGRR